MMPTLMNGLMTISRPAEAGVYSRHDSRRLKSSDRDAPVREQQPLTICIIPIGVDIDRNLSGGEELSRCVVISHRPSFSSEAETTH